MARNDWNREQLILAINLYWKIPFGQMHSRNKHVQHLATLIGRTPGAVARKLGNFASFDPQHKKRDVHGLPNAGQLTESIWYEFYDNLNTLAYESERLLASIEKKPIESLVPLEPEIWQLKEGKEKERLIKARVNQRFFRDMILASYNEACCITGIKQRSLLVASHISPWSKDELNRMNPQNGLCLNALHDKAFDNFLITVTPDYHIKVSNKLKKQSKSLGIQQSFIQYEGQKIILPKRYLPSPEFLSEHNKKFNERN